MMLRYCKLVAAGCVTPLIFACSPDAAAPQSNQDSRVETTGKTDVELGKLPPEVTAAAKAAQPDLTIVSAESETREGRSYYDLGGTLPDGSEVELDIMQEGASWTVVETQRDIAFAAAPAPVRATALAQDSSLKPSRVIESRQQDGVIIYEIFSPEGRDPQGRKLEVKWDGREASVLTQEWQH